MLRLPIDTPCQRAMMYYFEKPEKANMYSGRKRKTLPIEEDITRVNTIGIDI